MNHATFRKESTFHISADTKKIVGILLALFISIIGLTVFQDFLESNRSGSSFYFSESILFKTIWIVFIPLLGLLNRSLKNQNLDSFSKTVLFIVASIIIHLVLLFAVFLFFSIVFYGGRYDLHKVVTYTLANDLYKLVLIYSLFVIGHRTLSYKLTKPLSLNQKAYIEKIIIGNGKYNTVVEVSDIYQITAATPYISIQLEGKKYLHSETLKSITAQLDTNRFIRVHKSSIVNLDKVISFKSRLNGDYDIFLKNGDAIRLSRTYVADFKSKFKLAHQVTV